MRHANPVPDQVELADAMLRSSVFLTATKETLMSIDTDQPTHETPTHKQPGTRRILLAVVGAFAVVVVAVAVVATVNTGDGMSSSSEDPESVLRAFEAARNSGDVGAVMEFYAEDAVVKDSPVGEDGIANGRKANGYAEILSMEAQIPRIQGSTGGIEYLDMTVSGNTATFNHKFLNAGGDCFGGTGDQVTIEDGKITLYDWGTDDPSQCE
jgi:ketosteroid isomerase-like protein